VCWIREPADEGISVIDFGGGQAGLDVLATHAYLHFLGRMPTVEEVRALGGTSASPSQAVADLVLSLVAQTAIRADERFLIEAYLHHLGHEPDAAGWQFWLRKIRDGSVTRQDFIDALERSPERQIHSRNGLPAMIEVDSDRLLVSILYVTMLGRPPAPEEVRAWTQEATRARKRLLVEFLMNSPQFMGYDSLVN
ncbi:MAG: DUF4214 domain-containing protein, partial [Bryobacteraceae bacterium]